MAQRTLGPDGLISCTILGFLTPVARQHHGKDTIESNCLVQHLAAWASRAKILHLAVNIHFCGRGLESIMFAICSGWLREVGGRYNGLDG